MTEHTGGNTSHILEAHAKCGGQGRCLSSPCSTRAWAQPAQPLLCSWQAPAAAAVLLLHSSGAGPAPARRTPEGKWLWGEARDRFMLSSYPVKSRPIPISHPQGLAIAQQYVNISRFKSSNVKRGFTTATWRQPRPDAFRQTPSGQASRGFDPQPSLQSCSALKRGTHFLKD